MGMVVTQRLSFQTRGGRPQNSKYIHKHTHGHGTGARLCTTECNVPILSQRLLARFSSVIVHCSGNESSSNITTTRENTSNNSSSSPRLERDASVSKSSSQHHGSSTTGGGHSNASGTGSVEIEDSWRSWQAYFTSMDEIVRELNGVDDDIDAAVKMEDYSRAAALKQEQSALESHDTVLLIQKEMEAAVKEERYEDAAALRDVGGVRLLGWWIGKEGDDDAQGHLITVTRDFGRYVAHAFTGYTLAQALGWSSSDSGNLVDGMFDGSFTIQEEEEEEDSDGEEGTPVFEVFYRKNENNVWEHQTAVLNSPAVQITSAAVESDDEEDDGIHTVDDLVNSLSSIESELKEEEENDPEELFAALSEMSIINMSKRVPADIEWIDKDNFVLVVDEVRQKEIIQQIGSDQDAGMGADKEPETLREIENMVKAALSSTDATVNIIDDITKDDAISSKIAGLEGKVIYSRLKVPTIHTDAFDGIYLGSFGPHGPEILQVSRTKVDGQEWVQGVKLTGDVNVPAGQVSFKARIGKENKLSSGGIYPVEYGVQARYPGQGRVAREGYSSPKWVDGELLTLTKSNPITRGAEIGFVFQVDQSRKFLLLFERVDDRIFNVSP